MDKCDKNGGTTIGLQITGDATIDGNVMVNLKREEGAKFKNSSPSINNVNSVIHGGQHLIVNRIIQQPPPPSSSSSWLPFFPRTIFGNQPTSAVRTLPPCPSLKIHFTGRSAILDKLKRSTQLNKGEDDLLGRMTILTGGGGMGKSSTVKKFVASSSVGGEYNKNGKCAWINAETLGDLTQSFVGVAEHFKICEDLVSLWRGGNRTPLPPDEIQNLTKSVYQHFSDHVKIGLFIFDNANQMRTTGSNVGILDFLPSNTLPNLPVFLITTRNKRWGRHGDNIRVIDLGPFELSETLDYLSRAFRIKDDGKKTTRDLMVKLGQEILGGFPLALSLAASAISESLPLDPELAVLELDSAVQRYITNFEKDGQKWIHYEMSENICDEYDKIIATVWRGSMTRIREKSTKNGDPAALMAIQLMNLVAFFPPDSISVDFTHFLVNDLKLFWKDLEGFKMDDAHEVRQAFQLLENFSMVTTYKAALENWNSHHVNFGEYNTEYPYAVHVTIHRLVQKWTREILKSEQQSECLVKLAKYFKDNWEQLRYSTLVQKICLGLKDFEWPQGSSSYHQYIFFSFTNLGRMTIPERRLLLKDLYQHLYQQTTQKRDHKQTIDQVHEYLDVCTMAVIVTASTRSSTYTEEERVLVLQEYRETSSGGSFEIVNRKLKFDDDGALLSKIHLKSFLNWALTQSMKYSENQLMHQILARILYVHADGLLFYVNHETTREDPDLVDLKQKICAWINEFHVQIRLKKLPLSFVLLDICSDVNRVANVCLSCVEITKIHTITMTTLMPINKDQSQNEEIQNESAANCDHGHWHYFTRVTGGWDVYGWLEGGRFRMSPDCPITIPFTTQEMQLTTFVQNGGLQILTVGLQWTTKVLEDKNDGMFESLASRNLFGIIQGLAFFEACRHDLVQSTQFLDALESFLVVGIELLDQCHGNWVSGRWKRHKYCPEEAQRLFFQNILLSASFAMFALHRPQVDCGVENPRETWSRLWRTAEIFHSKFTTGPRQSQFLHNLFLGQLLNDRWKRILSNFLGAYTSNPVGPHSYEAAVELDTLIDQVFENHYKNAGRAVHSVKGLTVILSDFRTFIRTKISTTMKKISLVTQIENKAFLIMAIVFAIFGIVLAYILF